MRRQAYSSEAIDADACIFPRFLSTIVVIWVSPGLGRHVWNIPGSSCDSLAGSHVAESFSGLVAAGRRTLDALLDAAYAPHPPPPGFEGSNSAPRLETLKGSSTWKRGASAAPAIVIFVDATVSVAATGHLEQVHALTTKLEKRIRAIVPRTCRHSRKPAPLATRHLFESSAPSPCLGPRGHARN